MRGLIESAIVLQVQAAIDAKAWHGYGLRAAHSLARSQGGYEAWDVYETHRIWIWIRLRVRVQIRIWIAIDTDVDRGGI